MCDESHACVGAMFLLNKRHVEISPVTLLVRAHWSASAASQCARTLRITLL
jgi:hypothetical protein